MILTVYTRIEDVPPDIYKFGQSPISSYGYVHEDFFLEETNTNGRDRDPYISPEPTVRYSLPINSVNEPMCFAWDDFESCLVIESKAENESEIPWCSNSDAYRYDMPNGKIFFVIQH